ncbi:putative nucleotidyltransferase, ribonuclease H [Tanacetum coccineum]
MVTTFALQSIWIPSIGSRIWLDQPYKFFSLTIPLSLHHLSISYSLRRQPLRLALPDGNRFRNQGHIRKFNPSPCPHVAVLFYPECIVDSFDLCNNRTTFGLRPYHFTYPERRLTMEEMLYKFIDEGKREHEEMRAFISNHDGPVESKEVLTNDQPQKTSEPVAQPSNKIQTPPIPFPQRLRKEKEEAQQKKFLENLKQLHINLPFIEAIAQMPKFAKFLKASIKRKRPGSFTIPCDIDQLHINNALADLGASISLMTYTMYGKLGLGELKATRMSLELADRSIQYPRGIIGNVLIKVDKFVLPIDFVILDMPEDSRVPIILGRQSPTEDDECYGVDDLDDTINVEVQDLLANEEPDSFLSRGLEKSIDQSDLEGCEPVECKTDNASDSDEPIRHIASINTSYPVVQETTKPVEVEREHLYSANANEIDEKKPELKDLPHHLEYAYLHGDKSFHIIISSELSEKEKILLLQILMEDDFKPVIQPQRRLNPKVQDVVKNEIVKLLYSGLIYPISDSWWVSPIHIVPKKGGMIVVLNDNNELIPSRTVTRWNEYYRFLDGFSRFFKIPIAPEDQEKTTFTCPYRTFAYRRMPFGLCNAPATFQTCMTVIFHDMVEDFIKVFMEDFSVFGNSFDCCLANLDRMLARCEESNLVMNWEKCHFMVKEGIVLGHQILGVGIEVDRAKIDVIAKLPYPTNVKGVRSFMGHAGFYQRFIKDFSMISKLMTKLLMKDAKFDFSDDCKKSFNILKEKLTTAPIIILPDWNVPFELMCDASDFAVGAVLGQRIDGKFKPIYYASKTLNNAQEHYTTTEKELLAVDAKPRLIRWLLLLQGFDIKIKDKRGAENLVADHLLRLENPDLGTFMEEEIADEFPDKHLMVLKTELNNDEPWYADYVNYLVGRIVPPNWTPEKRRRFFSQVKIYFWDESYTFKLCPDNIMRRCVAGNEIFEILAHCHSGPTGGHHSASVTGRKFYESGFFWPSIFKDAKDYVMRCDACQ